MYLITNNNIYPIFCHKKNKTFLFILFFIVSSVLGTSKSERSYITLLFYAEILNYT